MERSFARLQTKTIDLMQVHNLVDVSNQLASMREWKAQGRFRYLGITHYNSSAFGDRESVACRKGRFPATQLFDHGARGRVADPASRARSTSGDYYQSAL